MNTRDPAFRRMFRRGVRCFGERDGAFIMVQLFDGIWIPLPYIPEERPATEGVITARVKMIIIYWNPDGKRWRRFDPRKAEKIIDHERTKGIFP